MKRNLGLLLMLICVLSVKTNAQSPNLLWSFEQGAGHDDVANAITTDINGNSISTGAFQGYVDFDPDFVDTHPMQSAQSSSWVRTDIYVQKLDPLGDLLWARRFGSTSDDKGTAITTDDLGNIYVTGNYFGTVAFDQDTVKSKGWYDVFILKLDPNGNTIWAKSVGASNVDQGNDIEVDHNYNVLVTGQFYNKPDFDPGPGQVKISSNGAYDLFVLKLDSAGDYQWVNTMGGVKDDIGHGITLDSIGNCYLTGTIRDSVDIDPGTTVNKIYTNNGSYDAFVQKLDTAGNMIFFKKVGGNSQTIAKAIELDNSNNILFTGYFKSSGDFDPGAGTATLSSNGNNDIFVTKLDNSGNYIWAKSFGAGSNSNDRSNDLSFDDDNNVYITGYYKGIVDFDPDANATHMDTTNGDMDVFIEKLDSNGNFVWVLTHGGTAADAGHSIHVTPNSADIFMAGSFDLTMEVEAGMTADTLTSHGNLDMFVYKLSQCTPNSITPDSSSLPTLTGYCEVTMPAIPTATNSCGNVFQGIPDKTFPITSNTTVIWTYNDGLGNVMSQAQQVVVNALDNTVTGSTNTITANGSGYTYQWIDCDNNNDTIPGATSQSFTPTSTGNYAVIVSVGNCVDTSDCYYLTMIGVGELTNNKDILVYPNPVKDQLVIQQEHLGKIQVEIFDATGKRIMSLAGNSQKTLVNVNDLSSGIYYVRVYSDGRAWSQKIIKE